MKKSGNPVIGEIGERLFRRAPRFIRSNLTESTEFFLFLHRFSSPCSGQGTPNIVYMSELHALIVDLALILMLAGVTSVLFKWLKQPVVLGYIVAGFIAGPHFTFFPNITDIADINIWAEIGIIVLLFSLGLEFNIKKLLNVGGSALITATFVVVGMMLLGYSAGRLLRFTYLDSLFLGGMLSMSSTTIILKAFTDLGLRKQKFTALVFGVLVVEDLFAVLMMVVLTSIAVNKEFEGSELIGSISNLFFFLICWFTAGVFLLPTVLKKIRKYLNDETLLIVSMGLCLAMVVWASAVGFSSALGAFLMGSILSGTVQAERIEKVLRPVKDLFGAVFFVSVGMLVDPEVLSQYGGPILLLSVVVMGGQILFGTCGMLLSGQSLQTSLKSGFSLAQIGEFAFIIATLGMTLNVIDEFLYPIVVAVSVITTFTTPFFIRSADSAYRILQRILPERIKLILENYSTNALSVQPQNIWKEVIGLYLGKIILYSTLLIAILIVSLRYFLPLIETYVSTGWAVHIAAVLTVLAMSPFLWALSLKKIKSRQLSQLLSQKHGSRVPFILVTLFRILLGIAFLSYFFMQVYSHRIGVLIGLLVFLVLMLFFSKKIQIRAQAIENMFVGNLNEREWRKTGQKNNLVHNLHLAVMEVKTACPFIGRRLIDADIRRLYGVNIVSIKRGNTRIDIPDGDARLFPGDAVSVVGTDEQIRNFLSVVEPEESLGDANDTQTKIRLEKILLSAGSPFVGLKLSETRIREKYACLVIGIERIDGSFADPSGHIRLAESDMLWIVGEKQMIDTIAKA